MPDRFDLTGKVALITGGSRGLGHAMALAYAAAGADIAIVSRKLDACETTAREIEALGRRALPVRRDLPARSVRPEPRAR